VAARAGRDVSEKRKISYVCRIRTPVRTIIAVPSTMSRLFLIQGSVSHDSACIIRDSNPATLRHGCEAFPGWSAAARFGVHQYVCQRDLVAIGNEPATPICELTAPTGLSEPKMLEKTVRVMNRDRSSNSICLTQLLPP
jgi:hypothetical protein